MKILIVIAHHRIDSLTAQASRAFGAALEARGHTVDWADLVREGFDPVMRTEDEPDWADPRKRSSDAVQAEMRRVERNDATVMIFPVYWWSLPAVLKGWIDRVWTNGWAYGAGQYPHDRVWMIGIAGAPATSFVKRGYDVAMKSALENGILNYCGIRHHRLEILYESMTDDEHAGRILDRMKCLANEFGEKAQ